MQTDTNPFVKIGDSFYKEHSVVMLPSEKASGLDLNPHDNKLSIEKLVFTHYNPQHLYWLSDEEIKEGDWVLVYYRDKWHLHKTSYKDAIGWIMIGDYTFDQTSEYKKIIATTNPELNLPRPSNPFLEAFVIEWNKGNKIERVLVEYLRGSAGHYDNNDKWHWKILGIKVAPDNTITCKL